MRAASSTEQPLPATIESPGHFRISPRSTLKSLCVSVAAVYLIGPNGLLTTVTVVSPKRSPER